MLLFQGIEENSSQFIADIQPQKWMNKRAVRTSIPPVCGGPTAITANLKKLNDFNLI